ncbi:MAG: M48 family metalloprotease, partial [Desulfurococcales archaeon]|nr:M48 family metalloprotease [Desulfurococcales archaeon]
MNGFSKLYASMFLTIALVTGISALILYLILNYLGMFSLWHLIIFITLIYILQWIISPYVIDAMYKVRPADSVNYSWLHQAVKDISMRSGIKPPRLMIADISIPNAFAYGNMLTGYKVAVTRGLLNIMPKDEVVAVIGHELGHIKHKDVAIMMIVGLLPAVILWIGEYLVRWGWLFGFRRDRDSLSPLAVVGIGAL